MDSLIALLATLLGVMGALAILLANLSGDGDWRIIPNALNILKKAWSVRLGIIAGLFSGLEVILPFFADSFPQGLFALLTFVAVVGAVVARFVAQPGMHNGNQ